MPLDAISRASAREKSVRHGHPSTLHLWWARRPLAACRAVLFAQLVDDPSAWAEEFPTEEDQKRERARLHAIIAEMVLWEATNDVWILNKARFEIARSLARSRGEVPPPPRDEEALLAYLREHAPPVCDPFCGGGSIPLEAQRRRRSSASCASRIPRHDPVARRVRLRERGRFDPERTASPPPDQLLSPLR